MIKQTTLGTFDPQVIKSIYIAFADMWNDIYISIRNEETGAIVERKKVFFNTAMGSKVYLDRTENYYVDSTGAQSPEPRYYQGIPRMNLNLISAVPDPDRQMATNQWRYFSNEKEINDPNLVSVISSYQPTAWNLQFKLSILTANIAHLCEILEAHILPYFGNTTLVLRIKEFNVLNIERDVPVEVFGGVNFEIPETLTDSDRRDCKADISFVVKPFFYRPYIESSVIKKINTNYYVNDIIEEAFTTSGVLTSGGIIVSGGYPTSGSYNTSGQVLTTNQEYLWFSKETKDLS